MLVTLELPTDLWRKATALSGARKISLHDLVIDALTAQLANTADTEPPPAIDEWAAFESRLQLQPDGSYINPNGLDDDHEFFKNLERIRSGNRD